VFLVCPYIVDLPYLCLCLSLFASQGVFIFPSVIEKKINKSKRRKKGAKKTSETQIWLKKIAWKVFIRRNFELLGD
jgi:hypothetical protein